MRTYFQVFVNSVYGSDVIECDTLDEAIDYLNYFEEQVTNLSIFPKIGLIPRSESIAKQGYRVLVSKKNLIFYKINSSNETITLHSIVSAKQDYVDLI